MSCVTGEKDVCVFGRRPLRGQRSRDFHGSGGRFRLSLFLAFLTPLSSPVSPLSTELLRDGRSSRAPSLPLSLVILEIIHQVNSRQHGSSQGIQSFSVVRGRRGRRENRSGAERKGDGRLNSSSAPHSPRAHLPSPPHSSRSTFVHIASEALAFFSYRVCFSWRVTNYRRTPAYLLHAE